MSEHHATLTVTVDVGVPAARAWAALVDWESQGRWMLGTTVRAVDGAADGPGGRLEAWTGLGRIGFLDTMTITAWEPPHRCLVDHTGKVVRGTGGFEITERGADACRVLWFERVAIPGGALGRIGWLLAGPGTRWGVVRSLRRFRRFVEASGRT